MDVICQAFPVTESKFTLVIRKLERLNGVSWCSSLAWESTRTGARHTMEFVKVAGTATIIHHTSPSKKSFPFPLTKLLTSLPSSSATYRLSNVRSTRKTLWPASNRSSLLRQLGITIFNNRSRFRKNSRFTPTFFRGRSPPSPILLVPGRRRSSTCCWEAAFCSEMALWMRFAKAAKRAK